VRQVSFMLTKHHVHPLIQASPKCVDENFIMRVNLAASKVGHVEHVINTPRNLQLLKASPRPGPGPRARRQCKMHSLMNDWATIRFVVLRSSSVVFSQHGGTLPTHGSHQSRPPQLIVVWFRSTGGHFERIVTRSVRSHAVSIRGLKHDSPETACGGTGHGGTCANSWSHHGGRAEVRSRKQAYTDDYTNYPSYHQRDVHE
jgi:hypothetical protein